MYEPESITCVRLTSVVVKEIEDDVACAYVPSVAITEVIVHVPALTNVTTPEEEFTVQTLVVDEL